MSDIVGESVQRRRFPWLVALGFMLIFLVHTAIFAWMHSPVIDEVGHLGAGVVHWATGDRLMYCVNPPLPRLISTLPAYLSGLAPDMSLRTGDLAQRDEFAIGKHIIQQYGAEAQVALFWGRMLSAVMVSGGICISMLWAYELAGPVAAILAGGLWLFSPMMTSHAALITPDAISATTAIGTAYLIRKWIAGQREIASWMVGVMVGLLLLTKFTWFPIVALLLPVAALARYFLQTPDGVDQRTRRIVLQLISLLTVATVAGLTIWSVYGFRGFGTPVGQIPFRSESLIGMQSIDAGPTVANRFSGTWLGRLPTPLPPSLLRGIDFQRTEFESPPRPHSFLMGQWQLGGWSHYYAIAWLVKTPVTTVVLAIFAFLLLPWVGYRQWKVDTFILLIPAAAVFVMVSWHTGFNRHLRYVLPAYPFLYVFVGATVAAAYRSLQRVSSTSVNTAMVGALLLLGVFQVVAFYRVAPHWFSSFNVVAGGPEHGFQWLLGSNVDWGQDVYFIKRWIDSHPDRRPVYLELETEISPAWLGLEYRSPQVSQGSDLGTSSISGPTLMPGWYIVSVNRIHSFSGAEPPPWMQALRQMRPTEVIAYTANVYLVTRERAILARTSMK